MRFPATPPLPAASLALAAVPASTEGKGDGSALAAELAAARQGCDRAARRLVEILYPTVIRIVRAHLPARCDEEDVAQEVFLKMFSRLDQYRGTSPVAHWVSRIATNTCLDLMRRRKARPEIRFSDLSEGEEAALLAASRTEPDGGTAPSGDSAVLLEKLLGSLKPDQQLVMRLLDVECHSISDIHQLTNWSISKIKMTAVRARRKLAEVITRLGGLAEL